MVLCSHVLGARIRQTQDPKNAFEPSSFGAPHATSAEAWQPEKARVINDPAKWWKKFINW